jgi:hypothetical protein
MIELSQQNKFYFGVVVGNTTNLADAYSANRKQEDLNWLFEQNTI